MATSVSTAEGLGILSVEEEQAEHRTTRAVPVSLRMEAHFSIGADGGVAPPAYSWNL